MGKVLDMKDARVRRLYRGMDAVEEATAALYYAAEHLAAAGHPKQAQDMIALCELTVAVRRELPHGLGPAA